MPTQRARLLSLLAVLRAASGHELLDRNCWPDFSLHYAACCQEGLPADPACFDEQRTFHRCCGCESKPPRNLSGERSATALGLKLSRHFFGPLLCDGPSVKARHEDFQVTTREGEQRLLRVYIYDLHRRFNGDILNRLQLGGWLSGSDCDYGLTLCTEEQWNGFFSVYRQFATEVLVLLKFLAAPPGVLTTDPKEADIFVVPYLAKTDCAESGNAGRDPCWGKCKCATAIKHLFHELPHYSWSTRGWACLGLRIESAFHTSVIIWGWAVKSVVQHSGDSILVHLPHRMYQYCVAAEVNH